MPIYEYICKWDFWKGARSTKSEDIVGLRREWVHLEEAQAHIFRGSRSIQMRFFFFLNVPQPTDKDYTKPGLWHGWYQSSEQRAEVMSPRRPSREWVDDSLAQPHLGDCLSLRSLPTASRLELIALELRNLGLHSIGREKTQLQTAIWNKSCLLLALIPLPPPTPQFNGIKPWRGQATSLLYF